MYKKKEKAVRKEKEGAFVDLLNQEMKELQDGMKQIEGKKWIKYQDEPKGKDQEFVTEIGYKSPIRIIQEQIEKDLGEAVYGAVINTRVEVDREELIKALLYDRGQYDKGYADGCKETAEKFAERLKARFMCAREYRWRDTGTAWVEPCIGGFINNVIDEICKEITGEKNNA